MSSKSLKERIAELRSDLADINKDRQRGLVPREVMVGFVAASIAYERSLEIIEAQEQEIERLKKYEPVGERDGRPITRTGEYVNSKEHDEGYF